MNKSGKITFWKNFFRYLLIGSSVIVLFYAAQSSAFQNINEVKAIQACTETPRDYPQCGGVCNGITYDNSHTVMVHKQVDDACNVSYQCEDLGQITGQCGNQTPPTCEEKQENYPQCGGTCNGVTYDSTHTVLVNKKTDCSGNVAYACADQGVIVGQCGNQTPPPSTPPACTETPRDYPQCGGVCNGITYDNSHTVMVHKRVDSVCGVSYQCEDLGQITGQCGNQTPTPTPTPTPVVTPTPTPTATPVPLCIYSSTQARVQKSFSDPWDNSKIINSGEQIRIGGFHNNNVVLANDVFLNVSGPMSFFNQSNGAFILPTRPGVYTLTVTTQNQSGSACQDTATFVVQAVSTPTPIPTPTPVVTPTPTPTPTPACVPNGSCSVSTPAVCGQAAVGVDNCGNPCVRQSAACTPAQAQNYTLNCPNGTNFTIVAGQDVNVNALCQIQSQSQAQSQTAQGGSTGPITITVPAPQVVLAGSVGVATPAATQVLGVTALPKTGLPEIVWTALAFIPAGFRMRRFSKVNKLLEDAPSYIWETRKFKANS